MTERRLGWYWRAVEALPQVFTGGEATGEEMLAKVAARIGDPPEPNAWGRVVADAIKRKLIVRTGERRAMKVKHAHGRQTDVYRRARRIR